MGRGRWEQRFYIIHDKEIKEKIIDLLLTPESVVLLQCITIYRS